MPEVSSEEFQSWLQSDVTKAVFRELQEEQEALAHGLSQGTYRGDPNESIYMGYVRAIREVINPDNLRENLVKENEYE